MGIEPYSQISGAIRLKHCANFALAQFLRVKSSLTRWYLYSALFYANCTMLLMMLSSRHKNSELLWFGFESCTIEKFQNRCES